MVKQIPVETEQGFATGTIAGIHLHVEPPLKEAWIRQLFERQAATALQLRKSTAAQRVATLKRLRAAVLTHADAIREAARIDMGKPAVEVDATEILGVLMELREAIRHTRRWMRPRRVWPTAFMLGTQAWVRHEPRGRCLIISPWNYPVYLSLVPLVSAIAAGNTVILKPSEMTPNLSAVLSRIVRNVFDEQEVALFEGDAGLSSLLLSLPFDHIFFTGSPAVGKVVMGAAAKNLASCTLELGGKSPTVIDGTADLRLAAKAVLWAKFLNLGQTCLAPDHVYVHESVREPFLRHCRELLIERYGADAATQRDSPDLARIVNRRHTERLAGLLSDAISHGARVLAGGEVREAENYIAPTLIDRPPLDSAVMQEEIFGPILPVVGYDTIDEAIAFVNARPRPLALYYFGARDRNLEAVLERTLSGGVTVNNTALHVVQENLPFGGVGPSGMGEYHGRAGFDRFSKLKPVFIDGRWSAASLLAPPYGRRFRAILGLLKR